MPAEADLVGIERRSSPEKLGCAIGGALDEREDDNRSSRGAFVCELERREPLASSETIPGCTMLAMRIGSPLRRSSTSVCRPESRSPGDRTIRTPSRPCTESSPILRHLRSSPRMSPHATGAPAGRIADLVGLLPGHGVTRSHELMIVLETSFDLRACPHCSAGNPHTGRRVGTSGSSWQLCRGNCGRAVGHGWNYPMPWKRVVATLPRKEALRMSSEGLPYRLPTKKGRRLVVLPTTQLGKWAVGLAAASAVLLLGWSLVGRLPPVPPLPFPLPPRVLSLLAISP